MKSSNKLFVELTGLELRILKSQVNESIALDLYGTPTKQFTQADMWNINRSKKPVCQRRFL